MYGVNIELAKMTSTLEELLIQWYLPWATPALSRHVINVLIQFNVKLPQFSGKLPNVDADRHLLVIRTCYNGKCKQMLRFQWSFQPEIAGTANLRPIVHSNFRAAV